MYSFNQEQSQHCGSTVCPGLFASRPYGFIPVWVWFTGTAVADSTGSALRLVTFTYQRTMMPSSPSEKMSKVNLSFAPQFHFQRQWDPITFVCLTGLGHIDDEEKSDAGK